jgi:hypothetical protein
VNGPGWKNSEECPGRSELLEELGARIDGESSELARQICGMNEKVEGARALIAQVRLDLRQAEDKIVERIVRRIEEMEKKRGMKRPWWKIFGGGE